MQLCRETDGKAGSDRRADVSHMYELPGFSSTQGMRKSSQRQIIFATSVYNVFAANTRLCWWGGKSGSPSGKSLERRGREIGLPWGSKAGMSLALEAVPQGGASHIMEGRSLRINVHKRVWSLTLQRSRWKTLYWGAWMWSNAMAWKPRCAKVRLRIQLPLKISKITVEEIELACKAGSCICQDLLEESFCGHFW